MGMITNPCFPLFNFFWKRQLVEKGSCFCLPDKSSNLLCEVLICWENGGLKRKYLICIPWWRIRATQTVLFCNGAHYSDHYNRYEHFRQRLIFIRSAVATKYDTPWCSPTYLNEICWKQMSTLALSTPLDLNIHVYMRQNHKPCSVVVKYSPFPCAWKDSP